MQDLESCCNINVLECLYVGIPDLSMKMTTGSKTMWAEARRNLRTMKELRLEAAGATSTSVRRLHRGSSGICFC